MLARTVDLFHKMKKSNHCLYELLTYAQHFYSLSACGHDFVPLVCFFYILGL